MAGLHPWVGGCAFYVASIPGLLQSVRAAFEWLLSTAKADITNTRSALQFKNEMNATVPCQAVETVTLE